jgi:hypothetical protein
VFKDLGRAMTEQNLGCDPRGRYTCAGMISDISAITLSVIARPGLAEYTEVVHAGQSRGKSSLQGTGLLEKDWITDILRSFFSFFGPGYLPGLRKVDPPFRRQ